MRRRYCERHAEWRVRDFARLNVTTGEVNRRWQPDYGSCSAAGQRSHAGREVLRATRDVPDCDARRARLRRATCPTATRDVPACDMRRGRRATCPTATRDVAG